MTTWKKVPQFPNYLVSDTGLVMGTKILKPYLGNHGYFVVGLCKDSKIYPMLIHRLVCMAFVGKAPPGKIHVAHYDGVKTNNSASNLRWASCSENAMDKYRHGTMRHGDNHPTRYMPECVPRGSKNGRAKLSERDVLKIRSDTRTQKRIAISYGVSQATINGIKNRKLWRHL